MSLRPFVTIPKSLGADRPSNGQSKRLWGLVVPSRRFEGLNCDHPVTSTTHGPKASTAGALGAEMMTTRPSAVTDSVRPAGRLGATVAVIPRAPVATVSVVPDVSTSVWSAAICQVNAGSGGGVVDDSGSPPEAVSAGNGAVPSDCAPFEFPPPQAASVKRPAAAQPVRRKRRRS